MSDETKLAAMCIAAVVLLGVIGTVATATVEILSPKGEIKTIDGQDYYVIPVK